MSLAAASDQSPVCRLFSDSCGAAQTEAFFAQMLPGYRVCNAAAVSVKTLASPVSLYFATPAQYSASGAMSDWG